MKKLYLIGLILMVSLVLFGCSSVTVQQEEQLEQFQGVVVEKIKENGEEKIFVVDGITQQEALESSYEELETKSNYNMRWFVSKEKGDFQEINKGRKVNVWWDSNQPHQIPGIPTLIAEKVDVIEKDITSSASELDYYTVSNTSSETTEGDFIYRLSTEKGEYRENESVKIYAELEYIGDEEKITIYHAASPFYFPMVEKTRGYMIEYPMNEPLERTNLVKGKPLRKQYTRSGGYGSQDGKEYVNFMKSFLENGVPTGYYIVSGFADFYVESNENGKQEKKDFNIKAQIDFKVKAND